MKSLFSSKQFSSCELLKVIFCVMMLGLSLPVEARLRVTRTSGSSIKNQKSLNSSTGGNRLCCEGYKTYICRDARQCLVASPPEHLCLRRQAHRGALTPKNISLDLCE